MGVRRVPVAVPLDECKRRAFAALSWAPRPASEIAYKIWPDATFNRPQGAGAAASRILKALQKTGHADWVVRYYGTAKSWGWVRSKVLPPLK